MDFLHIAYCVAALLGFFHFLKLLSELVLVAMGYEVTATRWWQKIDAKKKEKK
jgi:hypothetical protein